MAEIKSIDEFYMIEKGQMVHFTVTFDGKNYKWSTLIPKHAAPRAYIEAELDRHELLILGRLYPGAQGWRKFDELDDLKAFRGWIAAGHKNPPELDADGNEFKPETVIERQPFKSTHPPQVAFRKAFKAATTDKQRIRILAKAVLNLNI